VDKVEYGCFGLVNEEREIFNEWERELANGMEEGGEWR
jgi:hypothetical protein